MKNSALIFSLFKRFIGIIFITLNYLSYGLMVKLAADSNLSANERIVYPALVYAASWVFIVVGIYLAGPELVAKIKEYFIRFKQKFFNGYDK
tara:strand:- start:247 stop:522 length:276 start_codon:yes stop_codon:yes gene_type:complete